MAGITSRESRKMSLFKNSLILSIQHASLLSWGTNKAASSSKARPVALRASELSASSQGSIFQTKQPEPRSHPQRRGNSFPASTTVHRLQLRLSTASRPAALLLIFSQDVGVGGGEQGEWGGQVDRVLSLQPRYLGISLEHAVIRCNTSFHPPHDKPSPCGSWK